MSLVDLTFSSRSYAVSKFKDSLLDPTQAGGDSRNSIPSLPSCLTCPHAHPLPPSSGSSKPLGWFHSLPLSLQCHLLGEVSLVPWQQNNSLLRPLLLLLDFVFVKTGFYYVSLAGQKLYVDQVELPEALPLSLECCCIVSVGVAKPVTLKRSELCLYPGACWARVKARGNWRVLKELMGPSVLMLGADPYPSWVSSLPSFNPHQIPPVTRTLTPVSIY